MALAIILIIVGILFWFLYSRNKMINEVKRTGGMRFRYKTLVDSMISDPLWYVKKETGDSLHIVGTDRTGKVIFTEFFILHNFNKVNIKFKHRGFHGETNLSFEFPHTMDQNEILRILNQDIAAKMVNKI